MFWKNRKFIDKRDGKKYKTIKIGSQIWMAENLAFKVETGCWAYKDDERNVNKYGYLYNYETALKICPNGWKLPKESDFEELIKILGGGSVAYKTLIKGGNSGFSALLSGVRDSQGSYGFENEYAFFGSFTKFGDWKIQWIRMSLSSKNTEALMGHNPSEWGFSIRCIQDN